MHEEQLFQRPSTDTHIDIFLGEWSCDIPFGGGEIERVSLSLTDDSPRSHHHIPILRLHAGHQMDFEAHEQTPAGHASLLVTTWLNNHTVDAGMRYAAELFLWQWPGIRQLDDGSWQLAGSSIYEAQLNNKLIDIHGKHILKNEHAFSEFQMDIQRNLNLQVRPHGFCRKPSPCFLLDACLLCPHFVTNANFISSLQKRHDELQNKHMKAVANDNQRLASSCHDARINLACILSKLSTMPNENEENSHEEND
ncbi:MAG: hypothetical protein COB41_01630 [Proteobacteria bacterium]|nr:MAG: hypothetical protein COB41_01630 [Pseudomonadota bacterium]